jgi:hypothetical protein
MRKRTFKEQNKQNVPLFVSLAPHSKFNGMFFVELDFVNDSLIPGNTRKREMLGTIGLFRLK